LKTYQSGNSKRCLNSSVSGCTQLITQNVQADSKKFKPALLLTKRYVKHADVSNADAVSGLHVICAVKPVLMVLNINNQFMNAPLFLLSTIIHLLPVTIISAYPADVALPPARRSKDLMFSPTIYVRVGSLSGQNPV